MRFTKLLKINKISRLSSNLHCKINNRKICLIKGVDKDKFLQGITTNNVIENNSSYIEHNDNKKDKRLLYTLFLNPKGRYLLDAFLLNLNKEASLLDVDARLFKIFHDHFLKYRLTSKIDLIELNNHYVYHSENCEQTDRGFKYISIDPRLDKLKYRIYIETFKTSNNFNHRTYNLSDYLKKKYELGIVEGADIPQGSLPYEYNLDYLNALNYKKGCYIGQELIIRTHHTGVIRKRLLKINIVDEVFKHKVNSSELTPKFDTIYYIDINKNAYKEVGKVIITRNNDIKSINDLYILAVFRIEYIKKYENDPSKDDCFFGFRTSYFEDKIFKVKPVIPEWWPST